MLGMKAHEFTKKTVGFHALGWQQVCYVGHRISCFKFVENCENVVGHRSPLKPIFDGFGRYVETRA